MRKKVIICKDGAIFVPLLSAINGMICTQIKPNSSFSRLCVKKTVLKEGQILCTYVIGKTSLGGLHQNRKHAKTPRQNAWVESHGQQPSDKNPRKTLAGRMPQKFPGLHNPTPRIKSPKMASNFGQNLLHLLHETGYLLERWILSEGCSPRFLNTHAFFSFCCTSVSSGSQP